MSIKNKLKVFFLGYRATSESYLKELSRLGATIGENVQLFRPFNTTIDVTNPYLITIGNDVMITGPVTILTHDYSWCVLKKVYGNILGNQKPVYIGNNIFIGWGATILGGTIIEDNTIIGANSVVSGHLKGNAVYAGNPARCIMSLDDFYKKRLESQLVEAVAFVNTYYRKYNKEPEPALLNEYFYLFTNSNDEDLIELYKSQLDLMRNREESLHFIKCNKPIFSSYEEFLKFCKSKR